MPVGRRYGLLYGILAALIVVLGSWWIIFMAREGRRYESFHLQRMAADRLRAAYLIETVPEIAADPVSRLQGTYPHLVFRDDGARFKVAVDPDAAAEVRREARRRQRMLISEGVFLLVLLAAGATILVLATRREGDLRRARELFLAGATHEFKTPLASLRLYTETLGRPELDRLEIGRIHARMLEDIGRLETLVDQVLALSREEVSRSGRRAVLDLGAEVRAVLAEMQGFLEGNRARVETSLPDGHCIQGERLTFALALHNLVHNAVRHSPAPARVAVSLTRHGRWLHLAVRDHGPGIPRRLRQKIFTCFFSGEPGGEGVPSGAGLGLYLVRRNAESLGGRVELASRPGEGSTFTLVLPAWEERTS